MLVFIPGAKSDCDLIYVAHAGQWPVSRPEAVLCHVCDFRTSVDGGV